MLETMALIVFAPIWIPLFMIGLIFIGTCLFAIWVMFIAFITAIFN